MRDSSIANPSQQSLTILDYLRDLRVIRILLQVVFVVLVVFGLWIVWSNIYNTLISRNLLPTFTFLERRAGFAISASPQWYSADSTYAEAFIVGVISTLQVVVIGLVLATVLGIVLGIFLLSTNWLVKTIARWYVEILRNTPLLVQLIFWYFVVWLNLPEVDITLPAESVMTVPLRLFIYLFVLIGVWLSAKRTRLPRRMFNGMLTAILLLEIICRNVGDSYQVLMALAAIGLLLLLIASVRRIIPEGFDGFLRGAGLMAIMLLVGHVMLDTLAQFKLIPHARVIYGDVYPAFILGRQGLVMPEVTLTVNFIVFAIAIVIALFAGYLMYRGLGIIIDQTGYAIPRTLYAFVAFLAVLLIGWFLGRAQPLPDNVTIGNGAEAQVVPLQQALSENLLEGDEALRYNYDPIVVRIPELNRFGRVMVGLELAPSYMALLIGLVIYTSAFIGEIVRAGIQAVAYGQLEAARSLGLSNAQTLRMIILPQALRIIIPPLGNTYLNLSKNSSLAAAIGYADTYQVGQTIMNQSGQSITGFFLVLVVYLSMSLIISLFMNIVNSRFQLVTR
jgi:general L-amino acid transport system permease protein